MALEGVKRRVKMADKGRNQALVLRLDKFLAEMGQGTRSQVKEIIRKGRIQVNEIGRAHV